MNKKIQNYIQKLSEPQLFNRIMWTLACLFVAFLIFQAGMFVGFHKAVFGHDWRENYSQNFGPARGGHGMNGLPENFPNAHGAIGKIITVTLPTIILEDRDGTEKIVLVTDDTKIRQMREEGTSSDLKLDSYVVVIGSPNDKGQIVAKLIRILPAPPIDIKIADPITKTQ